MRNLIRVNVILKPAILATAVMRRRNKILQNEVMPPWIDSYYLQPEQLLAS